MALNKILRDKWKYILKHATCFQKTKLKQFNLRKLFMIEQKEMSSYSFMAPGIIAYCFQQEGTFEGTGRIFGEGTEASASTILTILLFSASNPQFLCSTDSIAANNNSPTVRCNTSPMYPSYRFRQQLLRKSA